VRGMFFVSLTLSFLFIQAAVLRASTLLVPGSYPNIQAAINAASPGDVVLVSPGQYPQNLDYLGKAIAVRSVSGPAVTTINVNGGTAVNMESNSELTGFTVSGAAADFGAGVAISGVGQLIKGNIFQNDTETAGGFGAAIGGNNASPTVEDNIFRNNSADSQSLSGVVCFVNSSSPVIVNNVFYNNPTRAMNFILPQGATPEVINNTVVGNTVGIAVQVFAPGNIFRNNIIADNGTGLASGHIGLTWQNNLLFDNTTQYTDISLTGTMGNLEGDPRFAGATDFHLTPGAAALAAGSPLLAPAVDFDGTPRPPSSIDIGAYQLSVPEPSGFLLLLIVSIPCLYLRPGRRLRSN